MICLPVSGSFTDISIDLNAALENVTVDLSSSAAAQLKDYLAEAAAPTTAQLSVRIGPAGSVDTVCTTGCLMGPYTVSLDSSNQPLSVTPSTYSVPQRILDIVNTGSCAICTEIIYPVDATINLNGFVLATNTGVVPAPADPATWATYLVDGSVDFLSGLNTSIAVDSSGNSHIAYNDLGNLKYATGTAGSWTTETVESTGPYTHAMAIDTSGKVHIVYEQFGGINYTVGTAGSWATEEFDSFETDVDIVVDSSGNPHISYNASKELKYATKSAGSWAIYTVEDTTSRPDSISIAIEASGRVHITYYGDSGLKHAHGFGGPSWTIEELPFFSNGHSMAIDSAGRIHISYSTHDLMYATKASGSSTWTTETVEPDTVPY